ncbi:N-formylglutamate amidohydrolase [Swingsia samuiensis]|uniref:N-formylglutamate amidohydrolase n=1 Tax=Swingsia samuiensis TaxID=1293412 RepID=A0A4Y6UML3_9PROT|nr:N-formylglutamate amidohydrolase [Swingsia samuiensis]QDH17631.1 N-formylglutamate amidohydrolase [Swingsia samuiensis]
MSNTLLSSIDPAPYLMFPERKPSPFVLVSDHAGRKVPEKLGDLGVGKEDWDRHIAWDIGIGEVGQLLHKALGSVLIEQVYSRLVIDCNRAPGHKTSIPHVSDETAVPGNIHAPETCRQMREKEILHPYHDVIEEVLSQRGQKPTALIALHSFTPQFGGKKRPWDIGILHNRDKRMSQIMLNLLREDPELCVGDNEPYVLTDTSDYTVPYHAETKGLPYLEIEIRQDLIGDKAGQHLWAERLAYLLPMVWERMAHD